MNRINNIWIIKKLLIMSLLPCGICLIFWGCGVYSFSGSTLPSYIKTVAVPLFENRTPEFGIDQLLTDMLIDAITQDNTLNISSLRNTDSILRGTILRIVDSAGQYDKNEIAADFRVNITIQVSFEDVKKRKVLWEETWIQWGSYKNNRDEGIESAAEKLSTDILNRTVSGW